MTIKQIRVDQIVDYLNTITDITDITGNRIYWGPPKNDNQAGIYVVVNLVSENNFEIQKRTRLEFRLTSVDDKGTFKDLMDLRENIVNAMTDNLAKSSLGVYGIAEDDNLFSDIDQNDRKIVIFDLLFYFTN